MCGFAVHGSRGSWLDGSQIPKVSCGGKSLAGSVRVAGVVRWVLEIPEDGSNAPWSPLAALAAPAFPVGVQLQRPCRVPTLNAGTAGPWAGTIGQWEQQGRVGCGRERQN